MISEEFIPKANKKWKGHSTNTDGSYVISIYNIVLDSYKDK